MSSHHQDPTAQQTTQGPPLPSRSRTFIVISILAAIAGIFLALFLSSNSNSNAAIDLLGPRKLRAYYQSGIGSASNSAYSTAAKPQSSTGMQTITKTKTPVYFLSHGGVSWESFPVPVYSTGRCRWR